MSGTRSRSNLLLLPAALCLALAAGCPQQPDLRTEDGEPDPARLFQVWCSGCHGIDGRQGEEGARLVDAHEKPREEILQVIQEGRGQMPGWRTRLPEDEVEALTDYVRQLGRP